MSSIEVDLLLAIVLFSTGLIAGTVDAIAGGGGLISLPMLMATGVPVSIALGTNKLQSAFGTSMAAWHFFKKGVISFKEIGIGLLCGAIGASLGAYTAQITHPDLLAKMIPGVLLLVFMYTVFSPRLGTLDEKARMSPILFYTLFGFCLSFYDGLLGPGTGAFWIIAMIFFLGFNIVKATAYTKVLNLNSNLIALSWFIIGGQIDYLVGFIMAAGQLLGGRFGAGLAHTKGAHFVRPCFLAMVLVSVLVLMYRYWF